MILLKELFDLFYLKWDMENKNSVLWFSLQATLKKKNKKEQGSFEAFFVVPGDFRYIWKKLIQT